MSSEPETTTKRVTFFLPNNNPEGLKPVPLSDVESKSEPELTLSPNHKLNDRGK